jgi:hypothetical protein
MAIWYILVSNFVDFLIFFFSLLTIYLLTIFQVFVFLLAGVNARVRYNSQLAITPYQIEFADFTGDGIDGT